MLKNSILVLSSFLSLFSLTSCSDESSPAEGRGDVLAVLGENEDMMECNSAKDGSLIYAMDSASMFVCVQGKWISLNGTDGNDGKDGKNGNDGQNGKDGKDGENGKDGLDGKGCVAVDTVDAKGRSGYNVDCANGRVGTLWNGVDGKDGVDGKGCFAADTINEFGVSGYNMTCNGERVGSIWNGSNGVNGTSCFAQDTVSEEGVFGVNIICGEEREGTLWSGIDGADGEPCYIKKLDAGYEINCGTDNVIDLYNGFCGTTPYDPAGDKFCYGVNLYDKCAGEAYDVTKKFCYDKKSIENLCGTASYDLSTKFCYNSKVYAKCNGKEYNPSQWTCSNNKATKTVSFTGKYVQSCNYTECDGSKSSFSLGSSVSIPAGVSSVTMTVSTNSIASSLAGSAFNITIGSKTNSIAVNSSFGSYTYSVSPVTSTFNFGSPLTAAKSVSGKVTKGIGQNGEFTGKLTFTYTP